MDRIANHRKGGVTDVYDRHSYEEEDQRIMTAVARHVLSVVEGTEDQQRGRLEVSLRRRSREALIPLTCNISSAS